MGTNKIRLVGFSLFILCLVLQASSHAAAPSGSFLTNQDSVFSANSADKNFSCTYRNNKWISGRLIGKSKNRFYPTKAEIKNLKLKLEDASSSEKPKLEKKIKKLRAIKKVSNDICKEGDAYIELKELPRSVIREDVLHLYRRAGLGVPPLEAFGYVGESIDALVEYFMTYVEEPELETEARTWLDGNPADPQYSGPRSYVTPNGLQHYALHILLNTRNQFHERLALMSLHDKISVSSAALSENYQAYLMINHLQLLRTRGARELNYSLLMEEIGEDPVMIKWLSLDKNIASGPNENYARELMELFTLDTKNGAGADNYTDLDIAQVARAFTGWNVMQFSNEWRTVFSPADFDPAQKVIFAGTAYQGSVATGRDVVRHIFAMHPNASESLAKWMLREYFREDADQALVTALAKILKKNNFNMREAFQLLLKSERFYKAENQFTIAKRPMDRVVHLLRVMDSVGMPYRIKDFNELGNYTYDLGGYISGLGCSTTRPESVFGCDLEDVTDGQYLINSANLITLLSNDVTAFNRFGFNYYRFMPNAAPSVNEMIAQFENIFGISLSEPQRVAVRQYLDCSMLPSLTAIRCNAENADLWRPSDPEQVRTRLSGVFRIFASLPQFHDLR